jgi:hypothetical protein
MDLKFAFSIFPEGRGKPNPTVDVISNGILAAHINSKVDAQ